MVRIRQFRLLVTSLVFLTTKLTKVYEDNEALVTSITANKETPRIRHVDLPLDYLHCAHAKDVFQAVQTLSRIQIANVGTKPESGPSLMRSVSIEMGHTHNQALSTEHCAAFIKPDPISCCKHY